MIRRITGKQNIVYLPKKASTSYTAGSAVFIEKNGGFLTTTSDLISPVGIIGVPVSSSDSDFTSTRKVPVDMPLPTDIFNIDVSSGTISSAVLGNTYNLSTDKTGIDISAVAEKGPVRVISLSNNGTLDVVFLQIPAPDNTITGPRIAAIVGDSILAGGNATTTLSGLISSGTTATGTWSGSPVNLGGQIFISGATPSEYNGLFTVSSTSGNNFSYVMSAVPSSSTATGTISAVLQHRGNERNFFGIANALMGWPVDAIYNMAVTGVTSATALSTFDRDVRPLTPDVVFIQVGTNDVYNDVAIATTKANITSIINKCFDIGARVILSTIPPRSDATATAARISVANNLNRWIRYTAQTTSRVVLFDLYSSIINPLSSTNAYNSSGGFSYGNSDLIHPSGYGAQVAAVSLKTALSELFPNITNNNRYVSSITDSAAITSGNNQFVTNPLMQGTAGTLAGGATGAFVPDNWTVTKTGAGATLAVTQDNPRSDGYGSNVIMTVTTTANNDAAALTSASFHSLVTAGDLLNYEVEVSLASITGLTAVDISVDYTVGGTSYFWKALSTSGSNVHWQNDGVYIFRPTVPLTFPSGSCTSAKLRVEGIWAGAGGGVIKVARAAVVKLN